MPRSSGKKKKRKPRNARKKSLSASSAAANSLQDPPRASLLGLPGELRNRIYRLVLVNSDKDHSTFISPQQHEHPAFLGTCRQIRHEATKIFEEENHFAFRIVDSKLTYPSNTHWCSHNGRITLDFGGKPNWRNLKAWVKQIWQEGGTAAPEAAGVPANSRRANDHAIAAQGFEIAFRLQAMMSWESALPILEAWKKTITMLDAKFWADEDGEGEESTNDT